MPEYIGVITNAGAEKIAEALETGGSLPELTDDIGIGDGGHDGTGGVLTPSRAATETPGEFMTKTAESFTRSGAQFTVEILLDHTDTTATGEIVSSLGIYDEEADLFMIINFTPRPKDEYNTITATWEINL